MIGRFTSRLRIRRAQYRRWVVSRRRVVPQPVLIRLRAVGVVAVVFGIIIQSLAGWEGPAAAGAAPRVQSAVSVEDEANTLTIEVPPTAPEELSLVVVSRRASPTDEVVAPNGWELVQRIDHPDQPVYQAVYRGPTGAEAAAGLEWSFTEEAATSLVHLVVVGAGSSLVANASATTGESDTTVAPLSVAPEDDSLVLDMLATDQVDGFLAPNGMVTEHADQLESFSTAVVSRPVGAGELPETAYALASGAAHAGVAVRLVLGPAPDPIPEQEPPPPEQPAEPVNNAEAQPEIDPGPSAPVGPAPEAEFSQPESDVSPVLEVNEGQFDDEVDAVVRGEDATVFLAAGNLVYDVSDGAERQAVRMGIVGADPAVVPALSGVEDGVVNYFIGSDPAEWVTDAEVADVIEYEDVVDGVDIRYLGTEDGLRYDLLIDAGVDPESVELSFDGAEGVRIDPQGELIVAVEVGDDLVFSAPVTYQEIEGERIQVESGYRLDGDLVGFELGDYDRAYPVVIDPTLQYGSYLGGAGTESGEAIALDGSGNIIVAGYSASADYPTTVGAFDTSPNGSNDVTITKLSADGTTVLWSTYLGGSGNDTTYDMALDSSGNVYATVFTTSSNFPTTAGAYDTTLTGTNDGVVFKLAAAGNALSYSTYLGANGSNDYLYAIAVDGSGQAVIAGATDGSGYPTTAGVYDTTFGGTFDAVVTKLNATGTGLVWSTFVGGAGSDTATEVALDASGNVYFTGQAASGYPTTAGAYDTTVSGTFDGHATKLSSTGASLLYSTVFGGTGNDKGTAIAITDATTLFVAGDTPSSDFPTTAGAYDTTKSSSDDMFALKLDLTQTGSAQLSYSTFIGGAGIDRVNGLAVDSNGRAHIAGWTQSSGLATAGAYDTTLGGSSDGVLAILGANGTTMTELTYIGGEGTESASATYLSGSSIYLTGSTGSTAFPVTGAAHDSSLGGTSDVFVVRFAATSLPNAVTVNSTGNSPDTSPGDGVCNTGGTIGGNPECTLRAAIQEANASATIDTIHFSIPAALTSGTHLITPGSNLPDITAPVTIDATTEPDFAGTPIITLSGQSAGFFATGLVLEAGADNSTIRGLVIRDFDFDGIEVAPGNDGSTIAGNYIGRVNVSGVDSGAGTNNGNAGIWGRGSNTTIGGPNTADRNVISGNGAQGIVLTGEAVDGIRIENNYIGIAATGSALLANGTDAIDVENGADGTEILDNVIAHPGGDGIEVVSSGTPSTGLVIQGNIFGTDPGLTADFSGRFSSISLEGGVSNSLIGGTGTGQGNVIANAGSNVGNPNSISFQSDAGSGISILGNSISGSRGIGIDLNFDGVTANDPGDGDSGPNDLLNYPVITSAVESGGTVTVTFDLDVPANPDQYRVEFFTNPSGTNVAGNYEAETFVSADTTAPGTGLTYTFPGSAGDVITATATRIDTAATTGFSSTSEISAAHTVTAGPVGFIVNSTADVVDQNIGNGVCDTGNLVGSDPECTLRAAVQEANASAEDNISVPAGTYTLAIVGTGEDNAAKGDLDVTSTMTITGAGSGLAVIQAGTTDSNGIDRLFQVKSGSLTLTDVTVRHGREGDGAGVWNQGSLTLEDVNFVDNTASKIGGAIYNDGSSATLTVRRGVFNGGTAEDGGAIGSKSGATVIEDTTFANNTATRRGGGFHNDAAGATVTRSVFYGNSAGSEDGGAIVNRGGGATLTLTNSTLSGNTANGYGGGLHNESSATLLNVTVVSNTATNVGGGIRVQAGTVNLKNSIVAGNVGANCSNSVTSQGYNIEDANTCGLNQTGDQINTDPLLDTLGDDGGLTLTHAIFPGGPAVDSGTNTGAPTTDQRGELRPVDGDLDLTATTDVGAYELDPTQLIAVADSAATFPDTAVMIDPIANDFEPNGDPLSLDSFTQGTNGTVTDNGDDTVTYTPDPAWTGTDTFTYVVSNGTDADTGTVTVTVTPHSDPMAIYRRSGQSTPYYRTWSGSTFGGELTSATVGEFRIIQGAESPTRDEAIVVGVDNATGTIAGELWDGSSWTALPALGSTTQTYWWSFDVAYEAVSSDAMVVYADGASLNYRVWNGSTWSAEASITEPLAGTPRQMQLASHPWADEMVLIVSDDSSQDYAVVWNGSSWGNPVTLHSGGAGDRTDVYVAYEQQSGRALVTYGKGTDDVYYRLWNGTWGGEAMLNGINGGYARWTTLASDPNSNNIVLGVLEDNANVWLAVWNGTSWVNQLTATTTGSGTTHPVIAVAFEASTGQALAAYSGIDQTPEYRTWTSGSGWSAEANAPSVGATPNSVMLYPDPLSDDVMLATQDSNSDLNYLLWNGSAWGSTNELTTNSGDTKNQPLLFLWNAAPTSIPVPVATDDAASTIQDAAVSVDVVANDTDPIGGGLTIDSITQGSDGTVTTDGTDVTYTPNASWIGTDTFTYTVSDANGGTDTATVTVDVLESVVLDDIQKGTATIANGSSSTTATINAVDPTKTFLTFTVGGGAPSPSSMTITGELTNATTLTFARVGTTGPLTIEWSVVEFASGVSVQRGSTTLGATTTDVPISSVALSRSFVLMNSRVSGSTFGSSDFPRAQLTSPTNLRLSVESSSSNVVKWQVIQYNDANVQRGTASFASGDSSKTATVSTVDTTQAWLVYSNTTAAGSANNIGQKLVRGLITNATTLTFDRSSTGQTLDVAWELVEFTDATSVQHASAAFASADTTQNVTITAVDPSRAIAVGGTTLYGGRSAYTSDDNPGVGWFTTRLTTSTNLRIQRNVALAAADLGWFVIHWPGTADPLVVNSTGDAVDNAPGDGYCSTGSNNTAGQLACTLRAAIQEANANSFITDITFDMPTTESGHSGGVWTITPGSALPSIGASSLVLDATTQAGYTATPVVEIDGTSTGAGTVGFRVSATDVTIRGFAINRFPSDGIEVEATGSGAVIVGNHIGLDATGLLDRGNGDLGIHLLSGSTIGGTTAADRNVISGNNGGIFVDGSDGNTVIGNYIGTDVTGNAAIPNAGDGIYVANGADNNTLGQPGAGNILSGNGVDGVEINHVSTGNVIQANTIGLGADGSTTVANGRYGVVLYNGVNNTSIGGTAAGEGNVISGNLGAAVVIDGNSNAATAANAISGNLIGTDSTGIADRGNGTYGVHLFAGAVNTTIGGTAAGAGNTISGNGLHGVFVEDAGTVGTLIEGNLIGLTQAGDAPLGNTGNGIEVDWEVPNQLIGGSTPGAGNVISGNLNGIHSLWANDMVIEGNIVGLDVTGTVDLGNTAAGIRVGGDNVVIGGTTAGARNVVSGNGNAGIMLDSATSAVLQGNYIGTDVTGLLDRGNSSNGIQVSGSGNQIGGSAPGAGNVISGNTNDGIQTSGSSPGTIIEGNTIGLGSDGSTPVPNSYRGISIYGTGARVGGTAAGAGNTIAANSSTGVSVITGATDVAVLGNVMVANGSIGIDLGNNGPTVNDAGDGDAGANDLLNFPTITSASESGGTLTVDFELDVPAGNYRVEFFTNTAADASGYGEGETLVHTEAISHPGGGSQGFTASFAGSDGDIVTATATEDLGGGSYGSTSEFSASVAANTPPVAVDDSGTANEDSGVSIDVVANDTDADGDTLSVQSVTQGVNGSVVDNGDGTVTYTPDPDWNGVDTFGYTVGDGRGGTDTGMVTVTVTPVNDEPVAVDDSDSIAEDGSSTVDVVVNDSDVDGDILSVLSVTQGSNGSVTDNGDGTVTYTPDADWNGVDSYTYTVTDGALTDTATVTVTVAAVNDAPVAVDDSDGISEDGSSTVDVLANDSDVDGDILSVQSVTQGSNGLVVDNGDGTVTYTPDADWNGVDSFTYTVTDGQATDTATVWVTVVAVNDFPVAVDDSDSIAEDGSSTVDVLVNDSDVDGDTLSVQSVTQGSNGSVTDNGDGTVTYTPDPDWSGTDTYTYTVSDGALTDTATVTVSVGADNDPPVAGDDSDGISEDGSSTVDVLVNDVDVDGDSLTVVSVTQGSNGLVTDNGDGTVTYTPDSDWNGVDSFTYTITDGLATDTATVIVTVAAVNDFPVAVDDSDSISEDGSSTVDVLANDSDVDGDVLFVVSVVQPAGGTVIDNGDGTVTYTPDADWIGVDSFSYIVSDGALTDTATVTVTVTAVNDAPVAGDDSDSIAEDGSSTVDVLVNDSDVDGDGLSVTGVTQGSNGSVTDNGDGTLSYVPDADWNGVDSYTYTVTDGVLTDTATVTVTVGAVNDEPVAVDDAAAIAEDGSSTVDVLANDSDVDGDTLSVQSVTQGSNGLVVDNGDGTVTYTPDPDWNGVDSYTYTVSDGALTDSASVTVTVAAVNDPPGAVDDADSISEDGSSTVDVLVNDSDVEGDTLTVQSVTQGSNGSVTDNGDGTVTYSPDPDWNGIDSYTYTVWDGADFDTTVVTVTVAAVNDEPVAVDDSDSIAEDGSSTVDVLANDFDVEGDILSVQSVTQGSNGSVVDNGDGTVTYTPDADWNGTDSFSYTVTDGLLTDTATVWVVVAAVNDTPVAVDDSDSIAEDGSSTVDVLVNDSDVDGDILSVTGVTQGSNGSVTDNGDGTVTYTPDADWNGVDSYTYTVTDGALTDTATVTVTVGALNDAPTAVDDSDGISEDGSSTVDVLANDSDVEGDSLSVLSVTQGANGSVVDNGDGTVTYTPDADWNGVDSFTYTVSDGLATDTATVWVTVVAVNDFPVAVDDSDSIAEDGLSTVDVLVNDSDVDGDTLSVQSVTQGSNGSVTDNGDGTVTYTPDLDFNGLDSYTYTVTDGALTDTATVTVSVGADNDPPVAGDDSDGISEDGSSTVDVLANDSDVDGDVLTVQSVTQGSNGSVVDNGDGTVTYTPDPDWNGTDSYTYTITDGLATDTATVIVTVAAVNDFPVAVDDSDSISEDGSSTVELLVNDSDVDGDVLFVVSVVQPAGGTVTDNGDGTVTYTPDADWNGVDSFSYIVSDGALTDTATVTVTVTAVNDFPVAGDDSDSIAEDGSSTVDVLVNDSDVDGDGLSVTGVTQGSNGSVTDNGDGTLSYVPDADWNGVDSYTYTVTDGVLTDTATVTVTVGAVNDFPVAVDDAATLDEDTFITLDLVANDVDVDGDALVIVAVTQPANGSVLDNGDGTVTYTPDPEWNGVDTFSYTVTDGALTTGAIVTMTVTAVNDAPVGGVDADVIAEDGSSTLPVLGNDTDIENDPLTVVAVTQGANGSVTDNGDGTVTYTPDPDWNGVDSYTYTVSDGLLTDTVTVTVTVLAVNDAPVAVDDTDTIAEDGSSTVDVLGNDTDVEGDVLAVVAVTQGANGSVTDNGDGTVTYTPDPDWNGVDSYTYTVSDGVLADTGMVMVTVSAVNDAPVAVDDADSILEDGSSTVDVLANDSDVDGTPVVTGVTQGANGTVVDNGDGIITYTPVADWNGVDFYTYTVSDGALIDTGMVTVAVSAVNDAPVAVDDTDTIAEDGSSTVDVLGNDTDVEGDVLTVVAVTQGANGSVTDNGDGTVTFTPDGDWNGVDSYTYTVSDGALIDTGMVTVTVSAVNDAPVAVDDADSILEDGVSTVDVLANDTDVDGTLAVTGITQGANGMVIGQR